MHISHGDKLFKTECVFFPPPSFFNSHMLSLPAPSDNEINNAIGHNVNALTDKERKAENKERSCRTREEELYNQLEETQPIEVHDGFVTYCQHFKYLGSFVSFSLSNDHDIKKCVTTATRSMGALKYVWDSPHLDI